jgi:Flp pilus assembly protein TadG
MQSGSVLIMNVAVIIVMIGVAALVVDVSRLHVIKQEMQNAADAAALRGANILVINPQDAIPKTRNAAKENKVIRQSLLDSEIEANTGFWNGSEWMNINPESLTYSQLRSITPAIKVKINKPNIQLLFSRIFSFNQTPLQVESIAVAPSPDSMPIGRLTMPISIYQDYLDTINLNSSFNVPTNSRTIAVWSILNSPKHGSPCTSVNDICLSSIVNRQYQQPKAKIGDNIILNGGVVNSLLDTHIRNCWQSACKINVLPVINRNLEIIGFMCTSIVNFVFDGTNKLIQLRTIDSGCPSGEIEINSGPNYGVFLPSKMVY